MSACNCFVRHTHNRGTCRRRGISWNDSTDTGSCSAGSQDTSRLASSGTRFASGCSVGRNPEDRSKILVINGRFCAILKHTGCSDGNTWDNEAEDPSRWQLLFRPGQRNQLTETFRPSSMPIYANSNAASLIKQLPFLSYEYTSNTLQLDAMSWDLPTASLNVPHTNKYKIGWTNRMLGREVKYAHTKIRWKGWSKETDCKTDADTTRGY
jgi:hypothetical protein